VKPASKRRRIAVLAVPPVEELDLVGPIEVFATANRLLARDAYRVELVTNARDRRIEGASGLPLRAHHHYSDLTARIDSLVVVCGVDARHTREPALLRWLASETGRVRRVGAVCVGAFLLAEAGLLDRRRATVHWKYAQELAGRFPRVTVDPNPIWVRDGNICTSAGFSAGIDLALAWVEEDFGAAAALKVARELVLFIRRPGGQDQFSATLAAQAAHTRTIHELQIWMMEHLDEPLSVDRLADRAAMSPRSFLRAFKRELGTTPSRYLAQLRVEAARRLLEQSEKGLAQIASASGFGCQDSMRRAFLAALGTTPGQFRRHFQRAR
jgi:transcriptional regulator GlxA family with amidase domain